MTTKKHKIFFASLALAFTLLNLAFAPLQSICGDQLKDIAIIPYISVNKLSGDDLTQKDTSANQLIADTLVKRFRNFAGPIDIPLQRLDKNAAWEIKREIANTFTKAVKHTGGTVKPDKEFFAKAKIPPHLKSALVNNHIKYGVILVYDALYHETAYQKDLNQQAIARSVTHTLLSYLIPPHYIHLHIEIPIRGKSMMQTIIYDVEKDKIVFLSAEYYEGRVEMKKIIPHFDSQYDKFF